MPFAFAKLGGSEPWMISACQVAGAAECMKPEWRRSSPIWCEEGEFEPLDENPFAENKTPGPVVLPVSPVLEFA